MAGRAVRWDMFGVGGRGAVSQVHMSVLACLAKPKLKTQEHWQIGQSGFAIAIGSSLVEASLASSPLVRPDPLSRP